MAIGNSIYAAMDPRDSVIAVRRSSSTREKEGKDGAVVDGVLGAAEGEAALVAVDDAGGDPEAEAGAVEILGGVKGLEEAGADGGRHAVAGVGDGDADAGAALGVVGGVVRGVVGADDEAASLTHGVDGIGDEVVEDLADVVFEAEDRGGGSVGGLDIDAGVGEAALIEVEDGVDQFCSADVSGADGLAVETEGLGGDLADAGEFVLGGVDVVANGLRESPRIGR